MHGLTRAQAGHYDVHYPLTGRPGPMVYWPTVVGDRSFMLCLTAP